MPTYDFYCKKCKKNFNVVLSMKDVKIRDTMKCDCGNTVEQIYSGGYVPHVRGNKKFLGDWYERNFHKDIIEGTPEAMGLKNKDLDPVRIKNRAYNKK